MHQNAFGGRDLSEPAGVAYSAPSGPLAGLKGKEREGEWERGKGRGVQWHPGDAKCVTEILTGTKIRKLGNKV